MVTTMPQSKQQFSSFAGYLAYESKPDNLYELFNGEVGGYQSGRRSQL
jgi:hypothetical protein